MIFKKLTAFLIHGINQTIRHLIHHASGLRSLHALLGMAGWIGDDSRTNDDLFRFMKNQKDLNLKPGDWLARIERACKESLV